MLTVKCIKYYLYILLIIIELKILYFHSNTIVAHWTTIFIIVIAGIISNYIYTELIENKIGFMIINPIESVLVILTGLILAVIAGIQGMCQFGGFDHSALIDISYRVSLGQIPGKDFPCTMPPLFYLVGSFAIKCFGLYWNSFILVNSIFIFITFLWIYSLFNNILSNSRKALFFTILVQALTTVLVSYWWYNSITTVIAVIFTLSLYINIQKHAFVYSSISFVLSLLLLVMTKPNISATLILGLVFCIVLFRNLRVKLLLVSAISFILYILLLQYFGTSIIQLISAYLSIADRGFSLSQFMQDMSFMEKILYSFIIIAVLFPILFVNLKLLVKNINAKLIVLVLAIFAGVYGFIVNGENKLVDIPLIYISIFLIYSEFNYKNKLFFKYYTLLGVFLISLALGLGFVRDRVKAIGYGVFFEYKTSNTFYKDGFFKGIKSGEVFNVTLKDLDYINGKLELDKLWFGPRMQWAYAYLNIKPPINQPSWWHPGVSFPRSKELYYFDIWKSLNFKYLIFYQSDITYLPTYMITYIKSNYRYLGGGRYLTILVKR